MNIDKNNEPQYTIEVSEWETRQLREAVIHMLETTDCVKTYEATNKFFNEFLDKTETRFDEEEQTDF